MSFLQIIPIIVSIVSTVQIVYTRWRRIQEAEQYELFRLHDIERQQQIKRDKEMRALGRQRDKLIKDTIKYSLCYVGPETNQYNGHRALPEPIRAMITNYLLYAPDRAVITASPANRNRAELILILLHFELVKLRNPKLINGSYYSHSELIISRKPDYEVMVQLMGSTKDVEIGKNMKLVYKIKYFNTGKMDIYVCDLRKSKDGITICIITLNGENIYSYRDYDTFYQFVNADYNFIKTIGKIEIGNAYFRQVNINMSVEDWELE